MECTPTISLATWLWYKFVLRIKVWRTKVEASTMCWKNSSAWDVYISHVFTLFYIYLIYVHTYMIRLYYIYIDNVYRIINSYRILSMPRWTVNLVYTVEHSPAILRDTSELHHCFDSPAISEGAHGEVRWTAMNNPMQTPFPPFFLALGTQEKTANALNYTAFLFYSFLQPYLDQLALGLVLWVAFVCQ